MQIKKSSKRIILFTHAGGSIKHGPNMRWYNLGQELKKHNYKITIVASSFFHKYIEYPSVKGLYKEEQINGIKYYWIHTNKYLKRGIWQVFNQIQFTFNTFLSLSRLSSEKPDLIIVSSPHPFIIYPAFLLSKICKCKLIYEARDLWPRILLELKALTKKNPYYWILILTEQFCVKNADFIIYLKKGEIDYYKKFFNINEQKTLFLPNSFHMADNEIYRKPVNKNDFTICYVGGLSKYYNIFSFISLAKKCQDNNSGINFILVGKGELEGEIRNKIKLLRLNNISMTGGVKRRIAHEHIIESDITYLSLEDLKIHEYGISCNKIYEYMYFKKAILGSYKTNFDPVKESQCGLVSNPGNLDKLYEDLIYLKNNSKKTLEMGINGYNFYKKFHTTKVNSLRFIDSIKRI